MSRLLASLALALIASAAVAETPVAFSLPDPAPGEAEFRARLLRGADSVVVVFEPRIPVETLLRGGPLAPWIERIDAAPSRTAAVCELKRRRGLSAGPAISQVAVSTTPMTAQTDLYGAAEAYDAFIFATAAASDGMEAVRMVLTKRAALGEIDCEAAYAIMRGER